MLGIFEFLFVPVTTNHLLGWGISVIFDLTFFPEDREFSGAGENTLRRLALFVYLDHPTKNDVTSGKKVS